MNTQEKEYARHQESLRASRELAEAAQEYMDTHYNLTYDECVKRVLPRRPNLARRYQLGVSGDTEKKIYHYTSHEASAILSEKIKKRQRNYQESYEKAEEKIFEQEPHLVECYVRN